MEWSKKINNKTYFIGTLLALAMAAYAGRAEVRGQLLLAGIVVGSVLNQWLMFAVLEKLLLSISSHQAPLGRFGKLVLWGQVGLKFLVLGVAFYGLINYARHLVAQGLLLYTFQLIILVLSIKNIGVIIKKGPSK